jgi:putative ABC transport system ATP-binding protein
VGLEPLEQGDIQAFGRNLAEWRMPDLRARVMYLPQRIGLPPGTVEEAVERPFGYAIHGDRSYRRSDVLDILRAFGREERFLAQRTEDLSGGEEQIVSFTRAILLQPDILLLDEPSASLDPDATQALKERLMQWHHEADRAFVITSHDPDQLDRLTESTVDLGGTS